VNVPPAISALKEITISMRKYTVVGKPEATGDGLWRVAMVPVDPRPREPRVSFARIAADGAFMGWFPIKRPKLPLNMIHTVRGRSYQLITELELMPDGYWHGTLRPLDPLPGETDRVVRFQSSGDFDWEGD
jgi:hypothetical protein